MEDDSRILALEHADAIASARLEVAEDFGWPLAIVAGAMLETYVHSWWIAVPAMVLIYFAATYRYRKESDQAEDAYFRVAGLGKHARYDR